jgi:rhodanese-related sulfurtransferase
MKLEDLRSIGANIKNKRLCDICIQKAMEYINEFEAILLDVRVPSNIKDKNAQEAKIPNAYYTPYTDFVNYVDILPDNKNTPIIVASYEGWFASRVKEYLEMLGFNNIYILCNNIEDWISDHLKIAK